MDTIASFTVDHLRLLPGVYVSRADRIGTETVTTFDIRMTAPNREPVINTAEIILPAHGRRTHFRKCRSAAEGPLLPHCRLRRRDSRRHACRLRQLP